MWYDVRIHIDNVAIQILHAYTDFSRIDDTLFQFKVNLSIVKLRSEVVQNPFPLLSLLLSPITRPCISA